MFAWPAITAAWWTAGDSVSWVRLEGSEERLPVWRGRVITPAPCALYDPRLP